jgi:hypothetical protein
MKFVSSTGFSHFEKGILWHERIDKLLGTGLFNVLVVHISSSADVLLIPLQRG